MLWALATINCFNNMSESDDDLPAKFIQVVGGPRPTSSKPQVYDPSRHGLFNFEGSSEDEAEAEPEASLATMATTPRHVRPSFDALNSTGRGHYSRQTAAQKLSHADQAHAAWNAVQTFALAGACRPDCSLECENRLTRDDMFCCIEASYGMITWVSEADLKVSKRQIGVAYGKLTEHESHQGRCALRVVHPLTRPARHVRVVYPLPRPARHAGVVHPLPRLARHARVIHPRTRPSRRT